MPAPRTVDLLRLSAIPADKRVDAFALQGSSVSLWPSSSLVFRTITLAPLIMARALSPHPRNAAMPARCMSAQTPWLLVVPVSSMPNLWVVKKE